MRMALNRVYLLSPALQNHKLTHVADTEASKNIGFPLGWASIFSHSRFHYFIRAKRKRSPILYFLFCTWHTNSFPPTPKRLFKQLSIIFTSLIPNHFRKIQNNMTSSSSTSFSASYPSPFEGVEDLGNAYVEILTVCQPFYGNCFHNGVSTGPSYYIHPRLEDGLALNNTQISTSNYENPQDACAAHSALDVVSGLQQHYQVPPPPPPSDTNSDIINVDDYRSKEEVHKNHISDIERLSSTQATQDMEVDYTY